MSFWLVTWEWAGGHAKRENKVAAVLSGRLSDERVRELVEFIYVKEEFSLRERIAYAKNKRNNPYPAIFGSIEGIPYGGMITCGHNPFLYARKVDSLSVEVGEDGERELTWQERHLPSFKRFRELNSL